MPLLDVIVFSIPEAIAITLLVYTLSGVKARWYKLVFVGCLLGSISYLLRLLISIYIVNTFAYAAVLITLLVILKVIPVWESVISALIAIPIYLLIEFVNVTAIVNLLNVDPLSLENKIVVKILCFLPQLMLMLLIIAILSKRGINLFWDDGQEV